jgi:hypothetical protein
MPGFQAKIFGTHKRCFVDTLFAFIINPGSWKFTAELLGGGGAGGAGGSPA